MTHLGSFLSAVQNRYHKKDFLSSDPLEFVHRYQDPYDQEVVAVLASVLAYGNVKQIRKSVADLLERVHAVSPGPAVFVRKLSDPKFEKLAHQRLQSFVHRFNRGPDFLILLKLIHRSWHEHGSVGGHFVSYLESDALDVSEALIRLMADWEFWAGKKVPQSFNYLLTSPADGSTCKRWSMFLRWMGRKDQLDPGLWTASSPLSLQWNGRALDSSQLVIPLDTHTGRISQYLGLTRRKSLNWKAAVEVTQALKKYDAVDPVRFDFSICRLGILDQCKKKYIPEICTQCQLYKVCSLAQSKGRPTQGRFN